MLFIFFFAVLLLSFLHGHIPRCRIIPSCMTVVRIDGVTNVVQVVALSLRVVTIVHVDGDTGVVHVVVLSLRVVTIVHVDGDTGVVQVARDGVVAVVQLGHQVLRIDHHLKHTYTYGA